MNYPLRTIIFATAFGLSLTTGLAESDLDTLIVERADIAARLHAAKNQFKQDRAIRESRLDQLTQDLATTKSELAAQKAEQQASIQALHSSGAENLGDVQAIAAWKNTARAIAKKTRLRIESGIPFDRSKRLEKIAQIERQLQAESTTAMGITQLIQFLSEELILSRDSRLVTRPVQLNERQIPAYRIRNGLANEVFISEDSSTYGIADKGEWRIEVSPTEKEQIKRAAAALRGQQPAAIIAIPVVSKAKK